MLHLLVTGGAGFIGSNFCRHILQTRTDCCITVLDAFTYAGHLENIADLLGDKRFDLVVGDIRNIEDVDPLIAKADIVINFAAESHVDRSIEDPNAFMTTNVIGVHVLLDSARRYGVDKFIQVSTDEVYGDIDVGSSVETDMLRPSSPYSASKAAAEHLALAYQRTYDTPVMITRGANTYGPYQHPEKLVPLFVTNAIEEKSLPVYGSGLQIRDWLHVLDHCSGIETVMDQGTVGEIYNIGGRNLQRNIDVIRVILKTLGKDDSLVTYVTDRLGHDKRYCMDSSKLLRLGWHRDYSYEEAMPKAIQWYVDNPYWWKTVKG